MVDDGYVHGSFISAAIPGLRKDRALVTQPTELINISFCGTGMIISRPSISTFVFDRTDMLYAALLQLLGTMVATLRTIWPLI